jgi:hypothetical protein
LAEASDDVATMALQDIAAKVDGDKRIILNWYRDQISKIH